MATKHTSVSPRSEEKPEAQQRPETPESKESSQRKDSKSNKSNKGGSGVCGIILAIICLILEIIILVFCVVGTPIDVFKAKIKTSPRSCYSMWGYKQCGPHKANPDGIQNKGFPSKDIRKTMDAAAAFAIISIFVTLVAMVLTLLLVCKCIPKIIPGIFSVIAFITILIVWACQAGVYYKKYPFLFTIKRQIKSDYKYAGSFGLFVVAWCLQTIEMILVFLA